MDDIDLEAELASLGGDGPDDDMLQTLYGTGSSPSAPAAQAEAPKPRVLIECAYCGDVIKDRLVHGLKHSYHPDHFLCSQCLEPLTANIYHEKKGKAYCSKCFIGAFGPRCHGCEKPIQGVWLQALGTPWHQNCFNCQHAGCTKTFENEPFFEHGERPFCETHYNMQIGSKCGTCGKPITAKHVSALGRKWHEQCFKCTFCQTSLAGKDFAEERQKAYCKDCYSKLFG